MPRLLLMKLIEPLKLNSESKLLTCSQLLMLTSKQEMMPPHTESTSKTKSKLPKNTLLGLTTEDKTSTEREKNSEDKDVFPI